MAAKKPAKKKTKAPARKPARKSAARGRKVKPVPDGYRTITSYLFVPGAKRLIEFLKAAFGARLLSCHEGPNGAVNYALLKIGDSMVMLSEPRDPWKPMPCGIYLYVADTDATYAAAMAAGGISLMEPSDQFYGDRNAGVQDPCGNQWWIATHIEDVSPKELERRMQAM
ncbi:MAG TPA: VOC family protein [Gammaproteobacteria bacterium]|jgi:uncharacterized glyoxalase superfamily protein PhnB|nr:VOC family protein [Gammaproteobacteria bacterium]